MAFSIIEIGLNDDLQTVVRKVNSNFSNVSSAAYDGNTTSIVAEEKSESAAKQIVFLTGQLDEFRTWVDGKLSAINTKFNAIAEQLDEIEDALDDIQTRLDRVSPPPIGMYIQADFNPASKYPSTTWKKITPAPISGIDTWHRIA